MLRHDLVVPEYHQAVDLISAFVKCLKELRYGLGAYAFGLGSASREAVVVMVLR